VDVSVGAGMVPVGVVGSVGVLVFVAVGVRVGVRVFVLVAVPVRVWVGVLVGVKVDVPVGVVVGVGVGTKISTEPSAVVPGTLPPTVSPKDAGGSIEKTTRALVVSVTTAADSAIVTIVPEGNDASGGDKSATTKSNSPSVSSPSKLTEGLNAGGTLKVTASGTPSSFASVGSNPSQTSS